MAMTKNFKNIRTLLYTLALSAPICAGVQAQKAVPDSAPAVPTPAPVNPAAATPATTAAAIPDYVRRPIFLVTLEGSFKSVFNSLGEARAAAQGNSYNKTLKEGDEIIVMNARTEDPAFLSPLTYSLFRIQETDIASPVKSYLDYRRDNPNMMDTPEGKQRERAMVDEVMKTLAASRFPRKAQSDPVPVELVLQDTSIRLETDDAQNPMIGSKIGDGYVYEAVMRNERLKASMAFQTLAVREKYGYNRYSTVQDAGDVATIVPGTKVIVFNGTNFSLYRLGDFKSDYKAGDEKFDVFKTTPMRKGWILVAIVAGSKFIKIYEPKAK